MVHERVRSLREKLERRKKKRKADIRAKDRKRRQKTKRIKEGNPKGAAEHVQAAAKEAGRAKESVKEAVSAEQRFLARELGVSPSHASQVAKSANSVLDRIKKQDGDTEAMDIDGDGDTDYLARLDQPLEGFESTEKSIDPTEPVVDPPGKLEEPVFQEGVGVAVDVEEPSDGEVTLGESSFEDQVLGFDPDDETDDDLGL